MYFLHARLVSEWFIQNVIVERERQRAAVNCVEDNIIEVVLHHTYFHTGFPLRICYNLLVILHAKLADGGNYCDTVVATYCRLGSFNFATYHQRLCGSLSTAWSSC